MSHAGMGSATEVVGLQSSLRQVVGKVTKGLAGQPWTNPLVVALAVGVLALAGFAGTRDHALQGFAVGLLTAGAALATGAILGFLFGIPRAVQEPREPGDGLARYETTYQVNTNLEQISDWLTKIIVGIGLIEISKIPSGFLSLSEFISTAFGSPTVPPSLAAVTLAYFGIVGFLSTYLWTRLLLTLEFTRADRAARQSPEFYEGLVHALLYQPAPSGFQSAISAAKEFLERFGDNWRVWRSLACAYGQQYGYLQASGGHSQEELDAVRANALHAVKQVIASNEPEREGLRALWAPGATPQEDDLKVFYGDPDFKAVLEPGSPQSPSSS